VEVRTGGGEDQPVGLHHTHQLRHHRPCNHRPHNQHHRPHNQHHRPNNQHHRPHNQHHCPHNQHHRPHYQHHRRCHCRYHLH
jgi:hypothetical protein